MPKPPPKSPGRGARAPGQGRAAGGQPRRVQKPERVKTARGRKAASTRWLQRQLSDPYVAEAQRQGYRSRAAFKLLQIDARANVLTRARRIVDLGAAPGGWTQIALERLAAAGVTTGRVVAIDRLEIAPISGAEILQGDFRDATTRRAVAEALGGPADLVLSDMAPDTTGHQATDHLRIMDLVEAAADFARAELAPGGHFVAKVFQGGTESALLAELKRDFARLRHVKPEASRSDSAETYLVATGFRGQPEQDQPEQDQTGRGGARP